MWWDEDEFESKQVVICLRY